MPMSFEPGSLAEEGNIPLCVPEIRGNEWEYIKNCLDTGWVSSAGPFVSRFEQELARYIGSKYAVATSSGTAALHLALLVAGVEPEDEVLVSTLTFIAPVNAVRYAGAWPVLIDAEPQYWQMDTQKVQEFLEHNCDFDGEHLRNKKSGRRVKAIIPVHILGHPVDMTPLVEAARRYKVAVIEDATEALGAKYREEMTGSLGDISCFSFNGNKIMTTGGGGMVVTNNEAWAKRVRYLSTQAKDNPVEYVHNEIGYNYRLTNLQAAMGCAQLERLDEYIAAKRRIAGNYIDELKAVPGITPMKEAPWASSTFWMFTMLIDEQAFGMDSRSLLRLLAEKGIQSRPLWRPIHLSIPYMSSQVLGREQAELLHEKSLSLPCSVGLSEADQARVIETIKQTNKTLHASASRRSI